MNIDNQTIKKALIVIAIALAVYLISFIMDRMYTSIEYDETVKISKGVEFKVVENRIVDKLMPSNYIKGYSYYNLFDGKKKILDVIVEVKNVTNEPIKIKDIFKKSSIKLDGENNKATIAFEESDGKDFLENEDRELFPKMTALCHFGLGVNSDKLDKAKNAFLKIGTKDGNYGYEMMIKSLDETENNEKSTINRNYIGQVVNIKDTISIPGICNFQILDVRINRTVTPYNNRSSAYRAISATQGRKYLDVIVSVTSLRDTDVVLEDLMGYCTVTDKTNNNIYDLTKVVEERNATEFCIETEIYKIGPNQEMKYHLITEMPVEVTDSISELVANLFVNGKYYILKIR